MASPAQPDFRNLLESLCREPDGTTRVEQALIRLLTLLLAESNRPLDHYVESGQIATHSCWHFAAAPTALGDVAS